MASKINWLGFAGGVTTLCLVAVSLFVPWWVLSVGNGLVKANVSPIYTDFSLLGTGFTVPLVFALNLASILTMIGGGIAILIYSVKPEKSYSKRLLGFGYSKPLFAVIIFIVILVAIQQLVGSIANLNVPIIGSATTTISQAATQGTTVTIIMSAELQWPFYLAIAAAALCIATRFYHKKLASPTIAPLPFPTATPANTTVQ